MKKSLLTIIASVALSISAFSQAVPSPFWTNQSTNFSIPSAGTRYFDAVDANVVWAIGYNGTTGNVNRNFVEFTRTINGGTSYTSGMIFPDTMTYHPASIVGIDANNAWVTSYLNSSGDKGAIHTTTNGGVNWTNMTASNMFTVAGVSFADFTSFLTPTVGVTVGDPAPTNKFEIYRTTNSGATWTQVPGASIPNAQSGEYGITDVFTQYSTSNIWFGTNKGRVYRSTDAGSTWSVSATAGTSGITRLAFRDAMNGIAYAYIGTVAGAYKTTDGGATWITISPLDPNMGLNDICAVPGTSVYASCGAGTANTVISYSNDDGATWNSWGGSMVQYLKIDFVNNTVGFAGGFSNNVTASLDGGFKFNGLPLGVLAGSNLAPKAIDMYPNPSNGNITIDLLAAKEGAVISVIDALGSVVYSETVRTVSFEKHVLNLEHLAKGIYSVNIVKAGETASKKIVIQ